MRTPLLEFFSIGIRHLAEIKDLKHRAEALQAASQVCIREGFLVEAEELSRAAADLIQADQAQLRLNERFSNFTES